MLTNFLKAAWRNMMRNKTHTLINIAGLALGLTCCIFIFLWVQDEKGIDNFHVNQKRLYVVYQTNTSNGKPEGTYASPVRYANGGVIPDFLLEDAASAVPEIKHLSFYATGYELPWGHPETIQYGEKIIKLNGSRAGKDFFEMFSYPLIEGNAQTALSNMNGIAISRKMADIFFGSPKVAIGKILRYENRLPFTVTAVFENLPSRSSMQFDFLLNMDAQKKLLEWASPNLFAYIELAPNADPKKVETSINTYMKPLLVKEGNTKTTVGFQPFGEQYLRSVFFNGVPSSGRIEYVRIFTLVALFIIIIACINFMNLATARSVRRAKEIGVRKVVGSTRSFLIAQFFGESLLFAFLAMLLSIGLLIILLPPFNSLTGKQILFPTGQISFWAFLFAASLTTGLLAGIYPALYLSSLNAVRVLKGRMQFSTSAVLFRKGLTIFQFVLSIILIISTITISRQINFIQHSHLGYDREHLLYVRIEGELSNIKNYLLFKQKATNMPGISMIDRSTETPHDMKFVVDEAINWEGKTPNDHIGFLPSSVGFDFIPLMKLQVAEGRGFSRDVATDSTDAFMVNEEAVRQMGMKNPIGKWVSAWKKKGHIIGILKDYNTQSLHEKIRPEIIDVKEGEYFGVILVRTFPGLAKQAIESLGKVYKNINPNFAFAYQFVDEEYGRLYATEMIISRLASIFAAIAIFISCLGLLGLAMFSAEQRIKEIGVRKVLGASVSRIVSLFSSEFVKLVLIAFLIAAPIAWILMNNWLDGFAYKVTLSWWIFLLAGFLSVSIALITIGWQAIKSAITNPINGLRTE